MLADEVGTQLLCLGHSTHAADAMGTGRVVDSNEALPLQSQFLCVANEEGVTLRTIAALQEAGLRARRGGPSLPGHRSSRGRCG
jgi:hypothetical protein